MTPGAAYASWLVVLAAMALAACGGGGGTTSTSSTVTAPVATGTTARTLDVDGMTRTYHLFVPAGLDREPAPLVLALHGSFNSAESMAQATQLDAAAEDNQFLVAYPEAQREIWNGGFCCTLGRGDPDADVRFLDGVITDAGAVHPVDSTRVYAVGVSAGGVMAYRLACDLAGRIAGVGSVAGVMLLDGCEPAEPVSVMAINGTADPIVPYEGGRIRGGATAPGPPVMAVAERWAALDACPGPPATVADGPVTTTSWSGCAGGTAVELVTVHHGGHNWYATEFGLPDGAVDATATLLRFFGLAP